MQSIVSTVGETETLQVAHRSSLLSRSKLFVRVSYLESTPVSCFPKLMLCTAYKLYCSADIAGGNGSFETNTFTNPGISGINGPVGNDGRIGIGLDLHWHRALVHAG